ncbi:hypothetical protein ACEUCM_05820 [Aeromonas dhakensis]|uniref:hypothetical protein n=1 Tax=Aeromonas dhakensis TaxID=196024 RepID=UPI0038D1A7FC
MLVDIYKAKKGFVFVKAGEDPANHVPDSVGYDRLVKKNHDATEQGVIGNPTNPNEAVNELDTKGYYHSSAGVNMNEAQSIKAPLDKNNLPGS